MTEADARALLQRQPGGFNEVEAWIAEQPWKATPSDWTVTSELQGWRIGVEVIAGGLRVSAGEPGTVPATWTVTG